jgi:AcrR family transcriptional regulator
VPADAPSTAARKRGRPRDESLPDRRREEILAAATDAFARDGFADADLQIVADSLGIGKGTIYRYFPTKRDLFLAAADRGMRLLREAINAATAQIADPLEQVRLGVRAYLAFFDAHAEFVELLIQERASFRDRKESTYFTNREAHLERWHALYRGLIGEGKIRAFPVEQITDVMGHLLYGTMFTNFFTGRRRSPDEQAAQILDVVLHGILTPSCCAGPAASETDRKTQGGKIVGASAAAARRRA